MTAILLQVRGTVFTEAALVVGNCVDNSSDKLLVRFHMMSMQVHEALPGSSFNSLLLNRYKTGSDYVAWHADDEKLYGPTPEIASISFGCEREFLLRKRLVKSSKVKVQASKCAEESPSKRLKTSIEKDQHSILLKHGSLLVMKGYTQRDWVHSVPKRARADTVRINLTFRRVLEA